MSIVDNGLKINLYNHEYNVDYFIPPLKTDNVIVLGDDSAKSLIADMAKLRDDNARLRAALEVYASIENWKILEGRGTILDGLPWLVAQKALGMSEKESKP